MDKFIGHLDDGRIQTLEEHLEGTATLAGQFARPFGMEEAGVLLGKNHDLGSTVPPFRPISGERRNGAATIPLRAPVFFGNTKRPLDRRPWQEPSVSPATMQAFPMPGRKPISPVKRLFGAA